MTQPVAASRQTLVDCIHQTAQPVKYAGSALLSAEDEGSAAPIRISKQNYHNIYENE